MIATTNPQHRPWRGLLTNRLVWGLAVFVLIANGVLFLWPGTLPVRLAGPSGPANALLLDATLLFSLFQLWVIHLISHKRGPIDFAARTPEKRTALLECIWAWAYALPLLALLGGVFGVGLHLPGTIYRPEVHLAVRFIFTWALTNFVLFALIPYLAFRARGYSTQNLGLHSLNLRADLYLVVGVLTVESLGEWAFLPDGFRFFSLLPSQIAVGGSLTLLLHLLGTGLPIMIFVQSILVPRYLKLTGSVTTSVVLGGLSYATCHLFEFWALYASLGEVALSLIFVYLQFTGAGMIKAFMTLRSGNAWTHLWGYHMIAPHLWLDAALIVTAFGLH